jgi:hypothetical protein
MRRGKKKEATDDKSGPSFKCRKKPVLTITQRAALDERQLHMANELLERCVLVISQ